MTKVYDCDYRINHKVIDIGLCTGKIRAIHSKNIENRPCIIKQTITNKN